MTKVEASVTVRTLVRHHEERMKKRPMRSSKHLHALAELGVRAGLVLVPAVPEPSLDLPHLPVQLLGEAVQMAGVWALWAGKDTAEIRLSISINESTDAWQATWQSAAVAL